MPYYAFKNENQLFDNWSDCEAAVKGYRNASYRRFATEKEAKAWLSDTPIENESFTYKEDGLSGTITIIGDSGSLEATTRDGLVMATDGSFNAKTNTYGGVALVVDDNLKMTDYLSIHGTNEVYAGSRNVSGEILAFCNTIAYAVKEGATTLTLIHDYEGIYKLATKGYKKIQSEAMKKGLKALDYAKENGLTTINFIWVNSHKGFPINELADHYAKKAVGLV